MNVKGRLGQYQHEGQGVKDKEVKRIKVCFVWPVGSHPMAIRDSLFTFCSIPSFPSWLPQQLLLAGNGS
jgi:hypothetical protein